MRRNKTIIFEDIYVLKEIEILQKDILYKTIMKTTSMEDIIKNVRRELKDGKDILIEVY